MPSDWQIWIEIRCANDGCNNAVAGRFYQNVHRYKVGAKYTATQSGWRLIANRWSCKECVAKAVAANR